MAKTKLPTFQLSFLHPKHWGLWLGVGLWRGAVSLPYPVILKIGSGLGWLFGKVGVGKKRLKVARRNLELCFPDKSPAEIEEMLKENQRSVGMAIMETGMAWFWSDKRIQKWSEVHGIEHMLPEKGVLFVGVHFLTLELGARIAGMKRPGIGVYRPNDNPVFDWLQTRGRLRSNKTMLDRKDVRGMIKALKEGEIIWYAPDHDYGRRKSVFAPLFAVPEAATTTGSHLLIKAAPDALVVPFSPVRKADNSGYIVDVSPAVDFSDTQTELETACKMNKVVEQEILKAPTQYMWMHRRFKTRPNENDPSLYD
ncbi:lipid A biosynthesis lauroyl acyltransferase [Actinobacillus delphinicola]|uniref:Kdo(2)-lipid IV(A) acyltransferase n=1 Tax=Actinobacillus delphinicola TaxID=51161 RepID=UPI0024434E0A|nr:LpxL/LpxP family Kdo(2)-lipid IV(A) lauroyl/palmitoleoyl acyltransferasee [Actinobacillus delphinicola]MDG6896729.1 lipid A biosynthesis lauroyl acyltransferase [Actinobacillus delphinicola]